MTVSRTARFFRGPLAALLFGAAAALTTPATAQTADAPAAAAKGKKKTASARSSLPPADAPAAKPAAGIPSESPMAELKKSNVQLKKVLQNRGPSWSPERDVRNNEVR